jgi:hypothetical protein
MPVKLGVAHDTNVDAIQLVLRQGVCPRGPWIESRSIVGVESICPKLRPIMLILGCMLVGLFCISACEIAGASKVRSFTAVPVIAETVIVRAFTQPEPRPFASNSPCAKPDVQWSDDTDVHDTVMQTRGMLLLSLTVGVISLAPRLKPRMVRGIPCVAMILIGREKLTAGASKENELKCVPSTELIVAEIEFGPLPLGEMHTAEVLLDHDVVLQLFLPIAMVGVRDLAPKLRPPTVIPVAPETGPFEPLGL